MDARLQLRVQRYGWDRAAAHYDAGWRDALAPATDALLAQARLQPGERVLDVACGSGVLTLEALRAVGKSGTVVATDLSQQMLETAAQNVRAAGLPAACFERVDAQELHAVIGEGEFDAVLCGLGLMYIPQPESALVAMYRCLRPGGRLVVSVWGERRDCGWASVFAIVDARVHTEVCPLFFRFGTEETLIRAMRQAGLVNTASKRLHTLLTYEDARSACDAAFLGGPVALAYSRFDRLTREAVQAEYLSSIARWRKGASYHLPGNFVIAGGERPSQGRPPDLPLSQPS